MTTGREVEGEGQALYQCSRCRRRYHRTEHLARHVRSVHTKQRPYMCRICGKGFGRFDVLRRHEGNMHGGGGGGGARPGSEYETAVAVVEGEGDDVLSLEVEGSERVRLACKGCKVAKVKCSERKPCTRCVGRGILCEVEGESCVEVGAGSGSLREDQAVYIQEEYTQTRLAGQDILDAVMDEDFLFGAEWDLAMTDLTYLQTRTDAVVTDGLESAPGEEMRNGNVEGFGGLPMSPPTTPESRGTGSWEPSSSENSEMERPHLAADEESLKAGRTPRTLGAPSFDDGGCGLAGLSFSTAARDAIVGMILDNTSRANAGPVLAAFPSVGALDALLDVYARECWGVPSSPSTDARINDVVHLPTLRLDRQSPELLGALAAMGAVRAGSAVARKFGYAMQDVVRVSSFRSWEENNANLCDISRSQAFFLQQQIAFFSGVQRKVAFAEACSGCMQVMIKNGGHLQGAMEGDQTLYQLQNLSTLDDGLLEDVWLKWSAREARRRLVYAAYIMDSHVGMAHGIRGMARYGDMRIPFPAPGRVWRAESAVRWREEMRRLTPGSTISLSSSSAASSLPLVLSLKEVMGDPTLVARSHHQGMVDEDFVILGFYAGLWVLIEECRQLKAISGHGQWSTMILSSRRLELTSMLKLFDSSFRAAGWEVSSGVEMMSEVLHMYISMSLNGDELRGAGVSPPLSQRINRMDSGSGGGLEERSAVWRAGRVLRAARRYEPGTLCGVYCVAVRDAGILLWRVGRRISLRETSTLTGMRRYSGPGYGVDATAVLVLDIEEDVQEYQVLDRNVCLILRGTGAEEEYVTLEDTVGVMRLVKGIVEKNWRGLRMPGGVEEVCLLLDGLGKVFGS
ncbi:hypothetical protein BDP55DRAFT_744757 [Colletotrichum godetiae]|uniref:Uncharacterized protein n=1 Tax=Colletotrichum godetiae TaxID=1209918 RepID=A0AAJ0ETK7_9PEZI|nr:uncharacterized protein BDP55DRAFT_744757 [Colletotrichum godetiae]KAK1675142.1 hypothetical protein BDP55DRAFT_744757 [Colletotrichum godetiae]